MKHLKNSKSNKLCLVLVTTGDGGGEVRGAVEFMLFELSPHIKMLFVHIFAGLVQK